MAYCNGETHPDIAPSDHRAYMEYALSKAWLSPKALTKFSNGAVLVDSDTNTILSTGYTLEFPPGELGFLGTNDPGNAHAEQCCFIKIALKHNIPEERIGEVLPPNTILYTTMEPCDRRLTGNLSCVDRILRLGDAIKVVYVGMREPPVWTWWNFGGRRLLEAGIIVGWVLGMEQRIFEVAMRGHEAIGKWQM